MNEKEQLKRYKILKTDIEYSLMIGEITKQEVIKTDKFKELLKLKKELNI